jgi:Zn-dependent protease with chaperone function
MNFFEHQEVARRRTTLLVAFYVLAVVLIVLALYAVVAVVFLRPSAVFEDTIAWRQLWNGSLFGWVALAVGALIGGGTAYKIHALSAGGETVAALLGGRPLDRNTADPAERRLLNVVEEMSIASGTPIPHVFVMDDEAGINAFAAGFAPADAAVSVTRGALERLNRDELQGVIAHEFSHILNGDMRLNIRLMGVLNGILVIAMTGYWILRTASRSSDDGSRRRGKKGGAQLFVLGFAMMAIGYIGVFFARLIKSAVSRQREFLADASSAQFTRNPGGLAGALKKIGGFVAGSRLASPRAEEASHLFFANGLGRSFLNLMATHPALDERIRRLDPSFDGEFVYPERAAASAVQEEVEPATESPAGVMAAAAPPAAPRSPTVISIAPDAVIARVGTLTPQTLAQAASLMAVLPADLLSATRTLAGAQAVAYGLLLNRQPEFRQPQLAYLSTRVPQAIFGETLRLSDTLGALPKETMLPLMDMAIATLKGLSAAQYKEFRVHLFHLTAADSEITLFEYAAMRMVARNLDPRFGVAPRPSVKHTSLSPLAGDCAVLLSALAWFGNEAETDAEQAFRHGALELGGLTECVLLPPAKASLKDLDAALNNLALAAPAIKQRILSGAVAAVSADGTVTPDEAEALRAVADSLDCPLPPFLPDRKG